MTVEDLRRLYDYSYWANRKVLQVILRLTPEQFVENVAGSYGSVRNTLVHIVSAEWGWLDRCGGPARGPALKADDYPTVDSLVVLWATVENQVRKFLADLNDGDLDRVIEFRNPAGEPRRSRLGPLMQHAANHASHHRGQVALLLRALGAVPGNFDLLFYDAAQDASQ